MEEIYALWKLLDTLELNIKNKKTLKSNEISKKVAKEY